jgi:plasmid stabilization system protein ParE
VNLKYALRALKEIDQCARWWKAHRDAQFLFQEELAAAIRQTRTQPQLGQIYRVVGARVQRRLLMPKTEYHLYYRLEGPDLILVLSVWGARRKRGPQL